MPTASSESLLPWDNKTKSRGLSCQIKNSKKTQDIVFEATMPPQYIRIDKYGVAGELT